MEASHKMEQSPESVSLGVKGNYCLLHLYTPTGTVRGSLYNTLANEFTVH